MPDGHATHTRVALSHHEIEILGRYNAERARGIVHTTVWQLKMADLQARFDRARR